MSQQDSPASANEYTELLNRLRALIQRRENCVDEPSKRAVLCDTARMLSLVREQHCDSLLGRFEPADASILRNLVAARRKLNGLIDEGKCLLYRAEYETRRVAIDTVGIEAKNADDQQYTVRDHIDKGSYDTRFVSFTTAKSVAAMYWAKSFKQGENRLLLACDASHFKFRVWSVHTSTDFGWKSPAHKRTATDREVVVECAQRSLSPEVIVEKYDCKRCHDENRDFRSLVDNMPQKSPYYGYKFYEAFAADFLDMDPATLDKFKQ